MINKFQWIVLEQIRNHKLAVTSFFHSLELENDFEKEKRALKMAEIKKNDSMQYWGISWLARLLKTCKWNIKNMPKISLRSIANMTLIKET